MCVPGHLSLTRLHCLVDVRDAPEKNDFFSFAEDHVACCGEREQTRIRKSSNVSKLQVIRIMRGVGSGRMLKTVIQQGRSELPLYKGWLG